MDVVWYALSQSVCRTCDARRRMTGGKGLGRPRVPRPSTAQPLCLCRVSKTRSEGQLLREAGQINKSLSLLEQVRVLDSCCHTQ